MTGKAWSKCLTITFHSHLLILLQLPTTPPNFKLEIVEIWINGQVYMKLEGSMSLKVIYIYIFFFLDRKSLNVTWIPTSQIFPFFFFLFGPSLLALICSNMVRLGLIWWAQTQPSIRTNLSLVKYNPNYNYKF